MNEALKGPGRYPGAFFERGLSIRHFTIISAVQEQE